MKAIPTQAVIFDMDGLLIDSEPLWRQAGCETLAAYGHELTHAQYESSTGLRTEEWVAYWFGIFQIDPSRAPEAVAMIIDKAIEKIDNHATLMPGAYHAIELAKTKGLKVGLASSSPMRLIEVVMHKFFEAQTFEVLCSAEYLPYGKPHPAVFINCAEQLQVPPLACTVLEDSFNGMIAAKAALMKCIVVPATDAYDLPKWGAADKKLPSLLALEEF